MMRNWDLGEFRVWVNLPSPIQQVWVPIRRVITLIQGLPNPIWQVVPLISRICSYPPHRSHLPPPSLSYSSTTLPSLQNPKLSHPSPFLHVIIIIWHRVQHTPSTRILQVQHTPNTASTEDCLSSLHSHDFELTPEFSISFRHASLHDRLPSASSPWELKGKVTLSHSHGCKLTNWWIESQHPERHPLTASKYSSKLARLRPPSLHDHSLQVHHETRSMTASKCISELARSRPPNSLDHSLQVRTVMASKCIFKVAWSWSRSASLSSLYHGLQVYLQICSITASKFAQSWPPSASPNTLDCSLQVYLLTQTIPASNCISQLARSRSPSASSNSLNPSLIVYR